MWLKGEKIFSLVNNSYRKVSSAWKNHCWDVKWVFYLNQVMPPAINHLVALPWTFFSLGRYDWFLEAGKVYLHWSHSADLSAISCEFNHIHSDGFHTINGKLFQTLQILKLSLLFQQRTNRTAVYFIRVTGGSSSWNAFYLVVEKWCWTWERHRWGCLRVQTWEPSLLWREGRAKLGLICLSGQQQGHAVLSTDPAVWKLRMLKKRSSNEDTVNEQVFCAADWKGSLGRELQVEQQCSAMCSSGNAPWDVPQRANRAWAESSCISSPTQMSDRALKQRVPVPGEDLPLIP